MVLHWCTCFLNFFNVVVTSGLICPSKNSGTRDGDAPSNRIALRKGYRGETQHTKEHGTMQYITMCIGTAALSTTCVGTHPSCTTHQDLWSVDEHSRSCRSGSSKTFRPQRSSSVTKLSGLRSQFCN